MHRLRHLKEAVRLHSFLMSNLTVNLSTPDQQITYDSICGSYCNTNVVIEYFYVSQFISLFVVLQIRFFLRK